MQAGVGVGRERDDSSPLLSPPGQASRMAGDMQFGNHIVFLYQPGSLPGPCQGGSGPLASKDGISVH